MISDKVNKFDELEWERIRKIIAKWPDVAHEYQDVRAKIRLRA